MQGSFYLIRNNQQKANAAAAVSLIEVDHSKPMAMKLEEYSEDRSARQNRLAFKWYGEVSKQGREYTINGVRAKSKHRYGLPILLAENEAFAKGWDLVAKNCNYEEQIQFIEDTELPITSLMTTKQMNRYLTDFQNELGGKYRLTDPSELMLDI